MNATQRARLAQLRRLQAQPFETVLIDADGELYTKGDSVRVTSVTSEAPLMRTAALGTVMSVTHCGAPVIEFDDGYLAACDDRYGVRLVTGFDTDYGLVTGRWEVRPLRAGNRRIVGWGASCIRRSPAPATAHATDRVFLPGERARALDYARAQARKNLR